MTIFFDQKGRLECFLQGGFFLDFIFSNQDDMFIIFTTLFAPKEADASENVDERVQAAMEAAACGSIKLMDSDARASVSDLMVQAIQESSHGIQLIQCDDGTIVMAQKIQAASLLLDEVLKQTLTEFFVAARRARKAVRPARRRMSWF